MMELLHFKLLLRANMTLGDIKGHESTDPHSDSAASHSQWIVKTAKFGSSSVMCERQSMPLYPHTYFLISLHQSLCLFASLEENQSKSHLELSPSHHSQSSSLQANSMVCSRTVG